MAYAFVAVTDWADGGSGTSLVYSSQTLVTGEYLVVGLTYGSGTRIVESFSDSAGNTYTYVGTANDSTNGQSIAAFVCKNVTTGGTGSITYTFGLASGASYRGLAVWRYTGLSTSAVPGSASQSQHNVATAANSISSGNVSVSAQPAMVFAFTLECSGSGSTPTAGTGNGFTSRGAMTNWDTYISKTMSEDKRVTSTSAVPGTFTASSATNDYLTLGIVVPEPGGGGGSPLRFNSELNGLGASGPFFNNPLG